MRGQSLVGGRWAALVTGLIATLATSQVYAQETHRTGPVRIGLVGSLFRDIPEPLALVVMKPFGALMESQTGLAGQLVPGGDALSVAQQLADDKLQLAVFHGVEFAWARLQHPDLQPLMIAINQDRHVRAVLVVRSDSKANGITDLKGKQLALPRGSRDHCHMFLTHCCQGCANTPAQLFAKITKPANAEYALDDVVDDDVQAAVVDQIAFDCFKRRKPGRCARLKVLILSEVFPAAVVAYHPGALDDQSLQHFREGMLNANKTAMGRQLMTLWKLTAFEPIPADYEETLANIVKAYPTPKTGSK